MPENADYVGAEIGDIPGRHSVQWVHDKETVYGKLTCHEDPGAFCRMACPESCPTWPCEHDLVDAGYCNALDYIGNCGHVEESYDQEKGDGAPVHDGDVLIRWLGWEEMYVWRYAPAPNGRRDDA